MASEANDVSAQIAYDGPALRAGSMDVRELAPALLAVGDLLQNANRVLNGERASIAVRVRSDFERGSFGLSFEVVQAFAMAYMFFGIDALRTAKEIAEYVGFITGKEISLFGLLKRLGGKQPKDITTLEDGRISISIEGDNNSVVVSPVVYQLASDAGVRKAASDVVRPLHSEGVDTFEVRDNRRVIESITREDLPAFDVAATIGERDIPDVDPERVTALEVIKPSFQEDLTWVFSDGSGGRYGALMQDRRFLRRVQSGERTFAKGDVLRVRLRSRAYMTADGLRTEHTVVEVIEELDQPRQFVLLPTPQFERPRPLHTVKPKAERKRKPRKPRSN